MEEKLMKAFQNILAYPYAWEKAGLGDEPRAHGVCRGRLLQRMRLSARIVA